MLQTLALFNQSFETMLQDFVPMLQTANSFEFVDFIEE
jgi:HKD family nuclease